MKGRFLRELLKRLQMIDILDSSPGIVTMTSYIGIFFLLQFALLVFHKAEATFDPPLANRPI